MGVLQHFVRLRFGRVIKRAQLAGAVAALKQLGIEINHPPALPFHQPQIGISSPLHPARRVAGIIAGPSGPFVQRRAQSFFKVGADFVDPPFGVGGVIHAVEFPQHLIQRPADLGDQLPVGGAGQIQRQHAPAGRAEDHLAKGHVLQLRVGGEHGVESRLGGVGCRRLGGHHTRSSQHGAERENNPGGFHHRRQHKPWGNGAQKDVRLTGARGYTPTTAPTNARPPPPGRPCAGHDLRSGPCPACRRRNISIPDAQSRGR